jgi:hypothetical protein
MRSAVLLVFSLGLGMASVTSSQSSTPASSRPDSLLKRCMVSTLDSLVTYCATIRVPENRSSGTGRMLDLRVVVIPPDSAGAELADPIVPVPGGPGVRDGNVRATVDSQRGTDTGVRWHW